MLGKGGWDSTRRSFHRRQRLRVLRLGLLDALLEITNCVEILADLTAVAGVQLLLEAGYFTHQCIQNAAILLNAGEPRRLGSIVAVAKEALEHRARLVL